MKKNPGKHQTLLSSLEIEFERENDGRWIAEIPELPGVMAYGTTKSEVLRRVYAVALRTLADGVEAGTTSAPILRILGHEMAER